MVNTFFDLLKSESVDKKLSAHRIFNVDETSISTVPGHNSKIVAMRGRKQISRITSADRGMSTTVVICVSAGGNYIPPLFIFSRKRMKEELKDGAPPGSIFSCNANGWMTTEVFSIWFDHFLKHAKPTNEDPALLILDGHGAILKIWKLSTKLEEIMSSSCACLRIPLTNFSLWMWELCILLVDISFEL